jgi:hypothetical protein
VTGAPIVISTETRTPRTTTLAVNYWIWEPSYGADLVGTESLVQALGTSVMRVGGYNNDVNLPDPFDDAALDTAVAYARAIGAEPLIQVPLLADTSGNPPTAAEAAAMVQYANVTKGYGVKYFAVGNEPDLYATSGSPTNSNAPAIPNFTPADWCTAATSYVAAMKAVDPSIQIIGPDLAFKYQAGSAANDWLTPILTGCGALFDVISIHRYPFEAAAASLAAASADPAAFRAVLTSVRGILQATGYAKVPLALTEMNVVYDGTTCELGASPGTVGSALWMADSLGVAIESGLWTSSVWDISDDAPYALGLIAPPPAHIPRPEYYAYEFYAQHFGTTLLDVTTLPAGVSAHASRNQADDGTLVIVVNWNTSTSALAFAVTGLAAPPPPTTFVLPAVSIAAVDIPDHGAASALVYSETERRAGIAPQALTPGVAPGADAGTAAEGGAGFAVGSGCSDAGMVCTGIVPPTAVITTMGTASNGKLTFGTQTDTWTSYAYAGTGQTAPTATVTPDGDGIQISGGFVAPIATDGDYVGVGLFFNGSDCVNASAYTGVKFDFEGSLGGCSLAFGASFSGDLSNADPAQGSCPGTDAMCYGPSVAVVPGTGTLMVPFATLSGGTPIGTLDPTTLVSVQWQLTAGADGGACSAAFSVENVSFY